jgi:hypothetical protein
LTIADISGWRVASAVDSGRDPVGADTQNRLQSVAVGDPLDLFALIRLRSTGGDFAMISARFRYDAVQHHGSQLRRTGLAEVTEFPVFPGKTG